MSHRIGRMRPIQGPITLDFGPLSDSYTVSSLLLSTDVVIMREKLLRTL